MKELEQFNKISEETKIVKPIKKEIKLRGTLIPQRGHKCFEIDTITNEICEAEFFDDYVTMFSSSYERKKKLKIKENCVYITALNKENAFKKYKKNK
jgi:hypothetical protein